MEQGALIFRHIEDDLPDLGSQNGCMIAVGANDVEAWGSARMKSRNLAIEQS